MNTDKTNAGLLQLGTARIGGFLRPVLMDLLGLIRVEGAAAGAVVHLGSGIDGVAPGGCGESEDVTVLFSRSQTLGYQIVRGRAKFSQRRCVFLVLPPILILRGLDDQNIPD